MTDGVSYLLNISVSVCWDAQDADDVARRLRCRGSITLDLALSRRQPSTTWHRLEVRFSVKAGSVEVKVKAGDGVEWRGWAWSA